MNTKKQIDDGGPAFPMAGNTSNWDSEKGQYVPQYGMSLRDWFAGQIILGVFADPWVRGVDKDSALHFAGKAYMVADAMLAARNQTKP